MRGTLFVVALTVAVGLIASSCGTGPAAQQQQAAPLREDITPDFVAQAQDHPPGNAFLGIGTGSALTQAASRSMAENRARVSLAQQMNSSVRNMIIDYTGTSEIEPAMLQFFETVSRTLAEANLVGTRPNTRTFRVGSSYESWTVMTLTTSDAHRAIANASEAQRALAPHATAALWGLERMDALFEQRDRAIIVDN